MEALGRYKARDAEAAASAAANAAARDTKAAAPRGRGLSDATLAFDRLPTSSSSHRSHVSSSTPRRSSDAVVHRLRALGYLNCSMAYDELKDGCARVAPGNREAVVEKGAGSARLNRRLTPPNIDARLNSASPWRTTSPGTPPTHEPGFR